MSQDVLYRLLRIVKTPLLAIYKKAYFNTKTSYDRSSLDRGNEMFHGFTKLSWIDAMLGTDCLE